MKSALTALVALPILSGCVAAVPLYMAASYGLTAFSLYQVYSVGNVKDAKYDVERRDPGPAELAEIQSAASVAVFPTNSGIDGAVVDTFTERSGLQTISSRTTIEYLESNGLTQERLLSYPATERAGEMQAFGSAVGADLSVFAISTGVSVNTNAFMASGNNSQVAISVKVYSSRTGTILLDEMHQIKLDVGSSPSNLELAQLAAYGISDRLHELRTGEKR